MPRRVRALTWPALALGSLAGGWAAALPGLPEDQQRALGVVAFALILWTARPVPLSVSSLAVLLLLPAMGLLDLDDALSPLGGPTVWLIFAGMVLSRLLAHSGLDDRVGRAALRHLRGHPLRLIAGLHGLGLAAAFLVPSGVVRVLLLLPVGTALHRSFDPNRKDRRLGAVITLSIACGTYYGGSAVLTGSVPNLVLAGQLEAATGRLVYWGEWLLWMFPVTGLLRTALCVGVIWALWGRGLNTLPLPGRADPDSPLTPVQRRTVVILAVGVLLWLTDVVHGLAPVYVGLLLVLVTLVPGWGPLAADDLGRVDFPFFFYLAAIFGLGRVLGTTGFNQRLVDLVTALLPATGGHWLHDPLTLVAATLPLDFLMDIAAVSAVATGPMLAAGAQAGLSPVASALSVAMATTVAFLPYQAAPFMVVLGSGTVQPRQLALTMFLISTVSVVFLAPVHILYWHWLGLL